MNDIQYQDVKDLVLKMARHDIEKHGRISWKRIAHEINERYPDNELSLDAIRNIYRRNDDEPYKATKNQYATQSQHKKRGQDTLYKMIKQRLARKTSIQYLVDVLPVTREAIYAEIVRLELDGYEIDKWTENGQQFLKFKDRRKEDGKQVNIQVNDEVSVLVISDTHIGHERSEIAFMQGVINYAYEQGIRTVLHVGDIVEGNYQSIRPTSIKELNAIGFDDQVELADKSIPKLDGLHYYMISGNHDFTHERNTFANPVKTLSRMRDDITYLGHNFGKVVFGKVDIALVHPTDGIGQSYGLKLHKYFDRAGADKQARIVLMGHYHKHTHLHYNGQDGFIVPALVSQSGFMKDNNLASVVGAFILKLKLNKKGELVTLTPEYLWKK